MANATNFIRSRRKISGNIVEDMAEQGRAPSFTSGGQIRGFRSRPGAPHAANDTMANLTGFADPMRADRSGLTAQNDWEGFFGTKPISTVPSLAPETPPDATGMAGFAHPDTDPATFASMSYPGTTPATPKRPSIFDPDDKWNKTTPRLAASTPAWMRQRRPTF